jgi:hypothetical protein
MSSRMPAERSVTNSTTVSLYVPLYDSPPSPVFDDPYFVATAALTHDIDEK